VSQHDAGLDVAHVDVERALQVVGILGADLLSRASLPLALMKAAPFSAMAMASFSVGSLAQAGRAGGQEGGGGFSWGGSCVVDRSDELYAAGEAANCVGASSATFPWVS
jgi:hypothetical protein